MLPFLFGFVFFLRSLVHKAVIDLRGKKMYNALRKALEAVRHSLYFCVKEEVD